MLVDLRPYSQIVGLLRPFPRCNVDLVQPRLKAPKAGKPRFEQLWRSSRRDRRARAGPTIAEIHRTGRQDRRRSRPRRVRQRLELSQPRHAEVTKTPVIKASWRSRCFFIPIKESICCLLSAADRGGSQNQAPDRHSINDHLRPAKSPPCHPSMAEHRTAFSAQLYADRIRKVGLIFRGRQGLCRSRRDPGDGRQ